MTDPAAALEAAAAVLAIAAVLAAVAGWASVVIDVCRTAFTYDPWIDPPRGRRLFARPHPWTDQHQEQPTHAR